MAAQPASPPVTSSHFVQDPKLQLPASCDPPSPVNPPPQRVWIVFGATGHIGRSIVRTALAHGDLVTAVGRTFDDCIEAIEATFSPSVPLAQPSHREDPLAKRLNGHAPITTHQLPEPSNTHCRHFLPLLCDVRVRSTVENVFRKSLEHWGTYDIVVNCAGYGVIGPCEEQDEYQIRGQFEINVWGTLNILQLSLPYFRTRSENGSRQSQDVDGEEEDEEGGEGKEGRYLIFSSTGGALGVPGLGPYCATKYAVEGLVESLLYETAGFDIRATLVEPGHVRRDDVPSSPALKRNGGTVPKATDTEEGKSTGHFSIPPHPPGSVYANLTSPAHHARRVVQWLGDRQPTSAAKAAELVWQLGHCRLPPLRLLLGAFAIELVRERMRGVTEEIEDWRCLNFALGGGDGNGYAPSAVRGKGRRSRSGCQEEEHEDEAEVDRDIKTEGEVDGDMNGG